MAARFVISEKCHIFVKKHKITHCDIYIKRAMAMKKVILSENKLNNIREEILKESFSDKVLRLKKFLDGNFMRATFQETGDDGTIKKTGIFIQLDGGKPTKSSLKADSVFDILQNKFVKILGNKNKRDNFLIRVIKDWYGNKKGMKDGILSKYDF